MPQKTYSHIIWDWNGTLLDDVDRCIFRINQMLEKRNKKPVKSIADYHAAFCFPIIDYYKNVGFDFSEEPFEALAKEYIDLYHTEDENHIKLHDYSEYVLKSFHDNHITQTILSASAQQNLIMQLSPFGIQQYFDEILGISDIYAKSKLETGLEYMARNNVQNGVMIGDTTHDYEVSKALGIDCVLVSQGHQSKEKLGSCGVPVFNNLLEVLDFLL